MQAARAHLARLEYGKATELLTNLDSRDALLLRGRAHWFAGSLPAAANDLAAADAMLADPWARETAILARNGSSESAYAVDGADEVSLPFESDGWSHAFWMEIDGRRLLAAVATQEDGLIIERQERRKWNDADPAPHWVNLKFGGKLSVSRVPARLGHPSRTIWKGLRVGALIGMGLLRRLHASLLFPDGRLVLRRRIETARPAGSFRLELTHLGGDRVATVARPHNGPPFLVTLDTANDSMLELTPEAWTRSGGILAYPSQEYGELPAILIGELLLPREARVERIPQERMGPLRRTSLAGGVAVHGIVGLPLLSAFRCHVAEEGRALFLEEAPPDKAAPHPLAGPGRDRRRSAFFPCEGDADRRDERRRRSSPWPEEAWAPRANMGREHIELLLCVLIQLRSKRWRSDRRAEEIGVALGDVLDLRCCGVVGYEAHTGAGRIDSQPKGSDVKLRPASTELWRQRKDVPHLVLNHVAGPLWLLEQPRVYRYPGVITLSRSAKARTEELPARGPAQA